MDAFARSALGQRDLRVLGDQRVEPLSQIGESHRAEAGAAPRAVGGVAALRNNAFEGEVACLAQKGRPAAGMVVAVAQYASRFRRNDLGEGGLAVFKRCAGKIPAVAIDEVEGEE